MANLPQVCRRLGHKMRGDACARCSYERPTTPDDNPLAPEEPGHCERNPHGDMTVRARSGDGAGYDWHCEACREDFNNE